MRYTKAMARPGFPTTLPPHPRLRGLVDEALPIYDGCERIVDIITVSLDGKWGHSSASGGLAGDKVDEAVEMLAIARRENIRWQVQHR